MAWPLLGERLGAAEIAGGLVIMSGVAVLRLGERAHAGAAPEALAGEPSEGVRERAA